MSKAHVHTHIHTRSCVLARTHANMETDGGSETRQIEMERGTTAWGSWPSGKWYKLPWTPESDLWNQRLDRVG